MGSDEPINEHVLENVPHSCVSYLVKAYRHSIACIFIYFPLTFSTIVSFVPVKLDLVDIHVLKANRS